jgi:thymidylate kinase
MKINRIYVRNHYPSANNRDGLVVRSKNPVLAKVMEERQSQFRQPQNQESHLLDRIALESRVIVVEGIPGSGKDTFQAYLKKKLKNRDVYDYSEGELLHSWKHVPIDGILKLRVNFMKLFVNCVRDIVNRDKNAVFILNRFHLSAYVTTIIRQPELGREYDEVINVLRTLPVHVFILQLDENEIAGRSSHSERSSAWQKYQQQRAKKDGFHDTLERYIQQQKLILEAAKRQQIPYSIIRLSSAREIKDGRVRVPDARSISRRGVQINAADPKISSKRARSFSKFVGR